MFIIRTSVPVPAMAHTHRRGKSKAHVQRALQEAERLCQARSTQLTDLRRRVLEIILNSDAPPGAYAILDQLKSDGRAGAPPTVYRALDFLLGEGLVHRIASANVFVACLHPADSHSSQFLICKDCGCVSELDSQALSYAINERAAQQDFKVDTQLVEIIGHCSACQKSGGAHAASH
jgi:Fur family zinc uptake transcriptional regulator